jgi:hypothetical protein
MKVIITSFYNTETNDTFKGSGEWYTCAKPTGTCTVIHLNDAMADKNFIIKSVKIIEDAVRSQIKKSDRSDRVNY